MIWDSSNNQKFTNSKNWINYLNEVNSPNFSEENWEVWENNSENKPVLINQVGCYGINLGRIDFYLSNDKKYDSSIKNIII